MRESHRARRLAPARHDTGGGARWRGRAVTLLAALVAVAPASTLALADDTRPGDDDRRQAAEPRAPHVVLVQESNGFPGAEESGELSLQHVTVRGSRMQVLDRGRMWALFVDAEERMVREGDVRAGEYVERPFSYYERYRKDRAENLASQREEFQRMLGRAGRDRAEVRRLKNEYRRMGGDPEEPGKLVARLQHFPQDRRQLTILINREERTLGLDHYVIRENQADRPVFDIWIAHELVLPVDPVRFYRELGTFSEPVTEKLEQLRGTIVELTAVLDTGSFRKTFKSRVLEIRTEEPSVGPLTVPAGWAKVDPERAAAQDEATVACAVCEVEGPRSSATTWREPWGDRKSYTVCSAEHRRELIRRLAAER